MSKQCGRGISRFSDSLVFDLCIKGHVTFWYQLISVLLSLAKIYIFIAYRWSEFVMFMASLILTFLCGFCPEGDL